MLLLPKRYAAFHSLDPDTASTILLFLPGLDGMDFLACVKGCSKLRHFCKSRTPAPEFGPPAGQTALHFSHLPFLILPAPSPSSLFLILPPFFPCLCPGAIKFTGKPATRDVIFAYLPIRKG